MGIVLANPEPESCEVTLQAGGVYARFHLNHRGAGIEPGRDTPE